jgi:hypothetical protein
MAVVMGVFSLYLMWKSAELPIGWEPRRGPGGGAFPFWLSFGMLICCIVIFVRGLRGKTPQARSEEPYMDRDTVKLFAVSAGSLGVALLATHWVGIYVAVPLFFIFYIRFVGRHSWLTTGAIAVGAPVVAFFFFEVGLKILLPKGFTEPLFYPLYEIFLST